MTIIFIHSIKDIMVSAFLNLIYMTVISQICTTAHGFLHVFAHSFGISLVWLVSTTRHIFVLKYCRFELFTQPLMPVTKGIEKISPSLLKAGKLCTLHNCARLYDQLHFLIQTASFFFCFLWLSVTMLFYTLSHQLKTAGKQLSKKVNGYEKDLCI